MFFFQRRKKNQWRFVKDFSFAFETKGQMIGKKLLYLEAVYQKQV